MSYSCSGGPRSGEAAGDGEGLSDLVTVVLVHCAGADVLEMSKWTSTPIELGRSRVLLWVMKLNSVAQRGGGYPREPSRAAISCIRTLTAALSRTGAVCEFEVPLGVGKNPRSEVT